MKVVLDASAAIPVAIGIDPGPEILKIIQSSSTVLAPELFVAEVTSGLWKYVRAGQMSIDSAVVRLERALELVERRTPTADLAYEVLREAVARRHSVYDMFYAVLARREGAVVVTLDVRLRKLTDAMGVGTA